VIQALADRDTLIVCDAHIHASVIDACRAMGVPSRPHTPNRGRCELVY